MSRILLVEDNEGISEGLKFTFEQTKHSLVIAQNIMEAEAAVSDGGFGLVLLDVALPDGNGFDFYKSCLRSKGMQTIFLTARDEENDIVRGLELGAEDYITKPFSTKELMARVNRALLRVTRTSELEVCGIKYDLEKMELTKDGERIVLSSLELKILHLMMEKHDKVVSRNEVIDCIWEATGNDVYDHTVTVYIKRIREKMGVDIIKTVKGVGYRIDVEGQND